MKDKTFKIDKSIYLDFGKPLSYNALLTFIITERGLGKSYGAKKFVAKRFINKGKQFVYLRRYKAELEEATMKDKSGIFFEQLQNDSVVEGHTFKNNNKGCYIDDRICGYFYTLSTAMITKSSIFIDVDTIVFDECLIAKGNYHYIPREVYHFLEFIESVGRLRDIKVFCLANAISENNPYFKEFGLTLPYNSEFKTFKNGLICLWYVKNEKYRKAKKESKFGKLIDGTNYGKYAMENEFLQDSKSFIKKKTKKAKYRFTICMVNKNYGVYIDCDINEMFISNKVDENHPLKVTLNFEAHSEYNLYIRKRSNLLFKMLTGYYYSSKLFFENTRIKNDVLSDLLKYLT